MGAAVAAAIVGAEVQIGPPQDVPQWYVDYFELKVTLATGSKEISDPPFIYLEEFELGPLSITIAFLTYLNLQGKLLLIKHLFFFEMTL